MRMGQGGNGFRLSFKRLDIVVIEPGRQYLDRCERLQTHMLVQIHVRKTTLAKHAQDTILS